MGTRLEKKYSAIALEEPVEIVEVGPLKNNPMVTEVVIKIAYHGENRNGSIIPKHVMENMVRRSLPLAPIVGNYVEEKRDFNGHDSEIELTEDFEIIERRLTKPYGAVGENPEVYWQRHVEKDGKVKEYIVTNAYIWTARFPEVRRILAGNNKHSMELDEATVMGEWDETANSGSGAFIITEANLLGLCILGADIEPAFESSDIKANFSLQEEVKKGFEENKGESRMDKLIMALRYNFNDDAFIASTNGITRTKQEEDVDANLDLTVADVDTSQEVEDIKNAVNRLDDAAEKEVNPESQAAIDEAIDTMLQVEQELDIEDQLIPISDKAKEVVESMAGDMKDIPSSPTFGKNASPLNKPFEEEETMAEKTPEQLLAEQEAAKQAQAAGQAVPATTTTEDAPTTADGTEPAAPVAPAAAPAVEPATGTGTSEVTVQLEDTPAQTEIDPVTGQAVEVAPRVSAEEKRKDIELAKYGDEELLQVLLSRVESADAIRAQLSALTATNEEAPAEGEAAPVTEDTVATDHSTDGEDNTDFADDEEKKKKEFPPVADDDSEDDTEDDSEDTSDDTETETEEEKKKKKNIQHFELENAKLAMDFAKVSKEKEALLAEVTELREFKAQHENSEKEEILSTFSLLDEETKATLRSNFSALSKEDLEARCALEYYRKGLMAQEGQTTSAPEGVVSYNLEGAGNAEMPAWLKAVKAAKSN